MGYGPLPQPKIIGEVAHFGPAIDTATDHASCTLVKPFHARVTPPFLSMELEVIATFTGSAAST